MQLIRDLIRDLRHALRLMRASPAMTAAAVLSLALGIGANTAIFTIIDALALRPLPVRDPGRLVLIGGSLQYSLFDRLRADAPAAGELSGVIRTDRYNVSIEPAAAGSAVLDGGPVRVSLASGNYFSTLGLDAAIGRTFVSTDDRPAAPPVAVISHDYWSRRFSRSTNALGQRLSFGDTTYEIVGVAPPGFFGEWVGRPADVWIPISWQPRVMVEIPGSLGNIPVTAIGRLATGVTIEQAQGAWQAVLQQVRRAEAGPGATAEQLAQIARERILVQPGQRGYSPQRDVFGQSLAILMSAVGLLLLIACANVANVLLARSEARSREMAVRLAIGANRARLVRQLLSESLLLAAVAGVLSVVIARWSVAGLLAFVRSGPATNAAAELTMDLNVGLDLRIFGFTAALSLVTVVLFGLVAAFRGSRVTITPALMGRGAGLRRSARGPFSLGRLIVVTQVALSLVLLGGAALLAQTLRNLTTQDLGFDRDRVLLVWTLPGQSAGRGAEAANYWQRAISRIASLPDVASVSASNQGVLNGTDLTNFGSGSPGLRIEGEPRAPTGLPGLRSFVAPGFFAAMGIPILAGRDFTEQDTAAGPRAVVISQAMARHYFGNRSPVGHRIWFPEDTAAPTTVVGVAGDFLLGGPREATRRPGYTYFSYRDREAARRLRTMMMAVRSAGEPTALAARIRSELQAVPLQLPVLRIDTVAEQLGDVLMQERLLATLSSVLAALSLMLAALGLYGVISYAVAQRTSEIGIRMALGATRAAVLRTTLTESMTLVAFGVTVGIPAMLVLTRLMASRLFGVSPADPATVGLTIGLMLAITTLAAFVPARRASGVDPMTALRLD